MSHPRPCDRKGFVGWITHTPVYCWPFIGSSNYIGMHVCMQHAYAISSKTPLNGITRFDQRMELKRYCRPRNICTLNILARKREAHNTSKLTDVFHAALQTSADIPMQSLMWKMHQILTISIPENSIAITFEKSSLFVGVLHRNELWCEVVSKRCAPRWITMWWGYCDNFENKIL